MRNVVITITVPEDEYHNRSMEMALEEFLEKGGVEFVMTVDYEEIPDAEQSDRLLHP